MAETNHMASNLGHQSLNKYMQFLSDEAAVTLRGGGHHLTLPFQLMSGHYVSLTLKEKLGGIIEVTDEGAALADLLLTTSNLPANFRQRITEVAEAFDLAFKDDQLFTQVEEKALPEAAHRLLQARMRIGDLLLLETVPSHREERLAKRLRTEILEPRLKRDLRPHRRQIVSGKMEQHRVDFLFNSDSHLAIKTLDRKQELGLYVEAWAFKWRDIREENPSLKRISIYDEQNPAWGDTELEIARKSVNDLIPYQDTPALSRLAETLSPTTFQK